MKRQIKFAAGPYVGATSTLVDAANEVGAPNPINLYGVLKVVGETIVTEHAANGAVARVAGVNGVHWLRDDYQPQQNPGFGHFAGAIVEALQAGHPFAVWTGPLNMVATPSLASESAEMILQIIEQDARGIFHCCGGESIDRVGFAQAVARTFGLDEGLISTGPPDMSGPVPLDTSLDAAATAKALSYELPDLNQLLATFRYEWERHELVAPGS